MTSPITYRDIKYLYDSNKEFLIVGSENLTNYDYDKVAIPNSTDFNYVEIPNILQGYQVKEIGSYAFYGCIYITKVTIKAKIKQINKYAFYQCYNLISINIPSSCELIADAAISGAIWINNVPYTTDGILSVVFEPNTTIKTLGSNSIERKEVIIIIYCGNTLPTIKPDSLFYKTNYSIIYTSTELDFGTYESVVEPHFCNLPPENKISYNCDNIFYKNLFFSLIMIFVIKKS